MIALLLLSIIPHDTIYRDSVDVIEVNHLYFDDGRYMMDQIIFWRWNGERHEVMDTYRKAVHTGYPERDWRRGGYRLTWTEKQAIREVRAIGIRETWTTSEDDPEKADREILPLEKRRQFLKIPDPPPFVKETPPAPGND